ncbi:MAG: hypothetical protein EAZ53_11605 [Bacteroidetes bacterium]|nr:MAG: hypothetical protein EAZ53_11605 [Bacteroidota bacterium]
MANKITATQIDASIIYEGGGITEITADELKGNIIAIRQLINQHNLIATENRNKERGIQELKAENEYLKTAPFVSVISAAINIVGSLIIGIATEMMGNELQVKDGDVSTKTTLLITAGVVLIVAGSFATILYPKAREWFNKKPATT